MRAFIRYFKTKKEAIAFEDGIHFVNDTSIEIVEIRKVNKKWRIAIKDANRTNQIRGSL